MGEWKDGFLNGKSHYINVDGEETSKEYKNGKVHGRLIEYIRGYRKEREYIDGKKNGYSREYDKQENIIHEAIFERG